MASRFFFVSGTSLLMSSAAFAVPDVCDGGDGLITGSMPSSSADVVIEGESKNDAFGRALATGDFNNDGVADLAVGATGVDDAAGNAGAVYVFFGGLSDPQDPSTANAVLLGEGLADFTGASLYSSGDLDGDGFEDLLVGMDPGTRSSNRPGVVYVVSGIDIASNSVVDLATSAAMLMGENNDDEFGYAITIGELTGDGVPDVIVGAPGHADGGRVYVFEGPLLGALPASSAYSTILPAVADSRFGEALAADLDFDGFGQGDLIIGARKDNRGGNHAGAVMVFLGGPGLAGTVDGLLDAAVVSVGGAYDRYGAALAPAGDLDAFGGDEIWATARTYGSGKKGRVYLLSATRMLASPAAYSADGASVARLTGDNANDFAGSTVLGRVDVNNDGILDVVVGGERADGDVLQSGAVWVAYGPFEGQGNLTELGGKLGGSSYNSFFGTAIAAADLDDDGFIDVVGGGWRAPVNGRNRGHVMMFRGGDDLADLVTWYADNDADGFGDSGLSTDACSQPPNFVDNGLDCDDTSSLYHPGADESCTDPDYNCDTRTGNVDTDGDGYDACEECDDRTPAINPGADEICGDNIDNDCDGGVDDGAAIDAILFCPDSDNDSFGNEAACISACEDPGFFLGAVVNVGGDCNDLNDGVFPGAVEYCDLFDNDCDSEVDESTSIDALIWYPDGDVDSYGDFAGAVRACSQPANFVSNSLDCDDSRADVRPGALEICDYVDNNCNSMHYLGGPESVDRARMVVSGTTVRSDFGREMAFVPDWDGDGRDELLIAAPFSADATANGGAIYIRRGDIHGGDVDFGTAQPDGTGEWDVRILPLRADSQLGASVTVGDVNGDGNADLLIGAPGTRAPQLGRGVVYGFLGPLPDGEYTVEDASFTIRGVAGAAEAGRSVALVDLDGDGFDEVVIGAAGEEEPGNPVRDQGAVHLFYGSASLLGEMTTDDADATFYGSESDEELGYAAANIDDIDGDGLPDLAVSGAKAGALETGRVYFLYGNTTRQSGTLVPDVRVDGSLTVGSLGRRIAAAGDVNADGLPDVLVGSEATRAYLLLGSSTRPTDGVANDIFDYQFQGPLTSRTGTFVTGLGDLNQDGIDDIAVGALKDDFGEANAGSVFVLYGTPDLGDYASTSGIILLEEVESFARTETLGSFPTWSASNLGVPEGARISGTLPAQNVGEGVIGGGDFNGDGVPDLVAAAPGWDASAVEADVGQVMLFLGGRFGVDADDEVDPVTKTTYVWDSDADRFVDAALPTFEACPLHVPISFRLPRDPVARGQSGYNTPYDCDDDNWLAYPGAFEDDGDGLDADCDGYDSENTLPIVDIELAPEAAYTSDDLVVVSTIYDDDGDTVALTYVWKINGTELVGQTSGTLTSNFFAKNDVVRVEVLANDGRSITGPYNDEVTIRNSLPVLGECRTSPSEVLVNTELQGIAVGLTDDDPSDLSSLTVAYQWYTFVGPFEVRIPGADEQTLASCVDRSTGGGPTDCTRGSILTLQCTPQDGDGDGVVLTSDHIVIGNTPPEITSCEIDQTSADTTTGLSASSSATDADGDAVSVEYVWVRNSSDTVFRDPTYPASETEHFDVFRVRCTPRDAANGVGASVMSAPLTISNTAPGAPVIDLVPNGPKSEDNLLVNIVTDADDIDGDTVTYVYAWTVDGSPVGNTTNTVSWTATDRGSLWEVTVTANDGFVNGGSDSDSVTITNTPPEVGSVVISPTDPMTDTPVEAVPAGWFDADGDPERYEYTWTVNGVGVVSGEGNSVLASSFFQRDDVISVSIRAIDAFNVGNTVSSSTVTVLNSPPTDPTVQITPGSPVEVDDLYCQLSGPSTDPDGDTLTHTYTWTATEPSDTRSGQSVSGAFTVIGQRWTCHLEVEDPFGEIASDSSEEVRVRDATAPPSPTIDSVERFRNEDSMDLAGTCIEGDNDCSQLEVTCFDGVIPGSYTTSCTADAWATTIPLVRGRTTSCYANCIDVFANTSLDSNTVVTEVCDPTDPYDEEGGFPDGYGDSGDFPVDEWSALVDDNSTSLSVTGNIVGSDSHDWYQFRTTDDPVADAAAGLDAYRFEVEMSVGDADYEITARVGSYTAPLECPVQVTYDDYEFDIADVTGVPAGPGADNHAPPPNPNQCNELGPSGTMGPWSDTNECEDHTADYFIRVERALGVDCEPYTLRVFNGRP